MEVTVELITMTTISFLDSPRLRGGGWVNLLKLKSRILFLFQYHWFLSQIKDAQTRVNLVFALPSDAQAIFEAAKAKVSVATLTVLVVKC